MNFRQRYKFDPEKDLIGKGGFARVYRAQDVVRERTVALKFYMGLTSDKYDIINEINRMDDIVHPNLIRYYDADIIDSVNSFGEKERTQVGIMEYANAGDISNFYKQDQPISVSKNIILDILRGLQYLHMQGIAHRDLKPKNILLHKQNDQLIAKICDFGISKRLGTDDGASSQLMGSVEYMAPEQFAPAVYGIGGKIDTNSDLWSLGIIIYEIFTKQLPFGSRTKGIMYEQILNNILFKDLEVDYSLIQEPFKTILKRCLEKNAEKRARQAEELIDILLQRTPAIVIPTIPTPIEPTQKPPPPQQQGTKTEILNPNALNTNNPPNNNQQNTTKEPTPNPPPKKNTDEWMPPTPPPKRTDLIRGGASTQNDINAGKNLFKIGDYPASFKILSKYEDYVEFDTEAKFYLGYMYYNGKCGGAHDVNKGRILMNEAKSQDRPLVLELMLKYVLNN